MFDIHELLKGQLVNGATRDMVEGGLGTEQRRRSYLREALEHYLCANLISEWNLRTYRVTNTDYDFVLSYKLRGDNTQHEISKSHSIFG